MTTAELQEKVRALTTTSIVTEQMGSWKYQNAFRKAYYHARLADNGKVVWYAYSHSRKLSSPQMLRLGIEAEHSYTLHNRSVSRVDAIEGLGLRFVKDLERRGWRFA